MSTTALTPVTRFFQSVPTEAGVHLDAIRGLAALAVFTGHARALLITDFSPREHGGAFLKLFYTLTGLGHLAVMVFFVLSGFLVGSSVLRAFASGRWSWRHYLVQRLVRLWVVLIPALVWCAVLDRMGMALFGPATGSYTNAPHGAAMEIGDTAQTGTPEVFVLNALFVQTIAAPTFGTNVALWSLANEFWYYMLFPMALLVVRPNQPAVARLLYAASFLSILAFVGPQIAWLFLVWLSGVGIALLRPLQGPRWWDRALLLVGGGLFAGTLIASRLRLLNHQVAITVAITATTGLLLYAILNSAANRRSSTGIASLGPIPIYPPAARWLAGFSYTLYLIHMPVIMFTQAGIVTGDRFQPTRLNLACWSAFIGFGLLIGWIFSQLTEARTEGVRHWVNRSLDRLART